MGYPRGVLMSFGLACVAAVSPAWVTPAWSQAPAAKSGDHSQAYYAFSMAHYYAELAQSYGGRGEYVNKAIDMYREAMKQDPSSSYIAEELADFYLHTSQLEQATKLANELIKNDPNNGNAHKILGRIYAGQVGDPERGKINNDMLKAGIEEYKKVVAISPKDTESLSNLARLYVVAHDSEGAETTYKAVLAIDSNDDDALTGLASVYADRGDLAHAIEVLKHAAEQNPDPTRVTALAELYEQNKQYSEAADAWKAALPLTNDNMTVRRHYAVNLEAANRTDEALKAVQDLAADDPKNPQLQLELAGIYQRKHDTVNAGGALAKAETILTQSKKAQYDPQELKDRIEMLSNLAQGQQEAGRTQDAISTLRQIGDLNPQVASKVEVKVIALFVATKDLKAARQAADAALKKYPGDRDVQVEHASLLSQMGDFDDSIREIRALSNANNDPKMLLFISSVQEKARRFSDEMKTLDAAEAASSSDPEKQEVIFRRGAMYERQKNFDAAEKQFRRVIASDPKNAEAMNYLGYMFADRNVRLDEAQQLISKALDLDPGNGAFLDSLGWLHFRQNHLDQAADDLRKSLDTDATGDDPTVHDHLAEVYFKQGKIREAIQQWEAAVAGFKAALPSDQDPDELAKVTKKLEAAKVKISEK